MNKEKKPSLRQAVQWIYHYIRPYKKWIFLTAITNLGLIAYNIYRVNLIEQMIYEVTNRELERIVTLGIVLAGICIVGMINKYISVYSMGKYSHYAIRDIKNEIYKHISQLPVHAIDKMNPGNVITKLNSDLEVINTFLQSSFIHLLIQPLLAIFAAIYLVTINWQLMLISICLLPLAIIISNVLRKKIENHLKSSFEHLDIANSVLSETLTNMITVKSFNMQLSQYKKCKAEYEASAEDHVNVHRYFAPMLAINISLSQLPRFICIVAGGYFVSLGYIRLEHLMSFYLLLGYITAPIIEMANQLVHVSNTAVSVKRIQEILDIPFEKKGDSIENFYETGFPAITVDDVSFAYSEAKDVVKHVSFKLSKGTTIALVGQSGCGKSSIIKLICCFYEPQHGNIKLYGKSYRDLSLMDIRKRIALVSQDVYVFPDTVLQNIRCGRLTATMDEVKEAATAANAHDFIMSLPDGYETMIGENGSSLSGGQIQRIAIARALIKDADILLLDEPTSALDMQSEKLVQQALNKAGKNRCIVTVSHRLSSIKNSDEILVLVDGSLIEKGTHDQLLDYNGTYKKLYDTFIE